MGTVRAARALDLDPEAAMALWTDVERWPGFVGGFSHVVHLDEEWPAVGSTLVWQSIPRGRGRVTERVAELEPGARFATEVAEEALAGRQTVTFGPEEAASEPPPTAPGSATVVELALEYELARFGALRTVADALFIRRALRDAQAATVRRFVTEAEREAAL